jgi:hypothetical protein
MEPYDQNIRRLLAQERIEQLVRDYQSVPRDRRGRRGRLDLRNLVRVASQRRARSAQPARS